MYEQEIIIDQYTILGVDVLIKEHQFPDDKQIWYYALFRLGSDYHIVKWENQAGLKKKVSLMIHRVKYYESR